MSMRVKPTDVVIVGMGGTGAIAAMALTEAGLDVVGLEAGPWRSTAEFGMDEIRNDVRNAMGPKFNAELPTSRATARDAAVQVPGVGMVNAVGGTTVHYTAFSWRMMEWNFRARTETIRRYGRAATGDADGYELRDWAVDYHDLEDYYDRVEYLLGVSGRAANVRGQQRDPLGNPFEAERRRGYPLPPLRSYGFGERCAAAARSLGWHPFRGPAAIHSEDFQGVAGSACQYCGFCGNNGCHTNAKAGTFLNAVPRAQATGNLTLRTGVRVTRVETDRDGRATGVTYVQDGMEHFQPAAMVILAAYIYENVRLLLLSTSKAFPRGLANNHDQVGRGYMSHGYLNVNGVFGERVNLFGPTGQYIWLDDWDSDNFDHTGLGFVGGGGMYSLNEVKPIGASRTLPPNVPGWGAEYKRWLARNAMSVGGMFVMVEDVAHADNRLDLDPSVKDATGVPVLRITFEPKDQEKRRLAFLERKARALVQEMGGESLWSSFFFPAINGHAYGGARMGEDPETSVADGYGITHEVPNLAVLGGALMPTSAGRNPTQTLQAMAWRTADHLVDTWSSRAA